MKCEKKYLQGLTLIELLISLVIVSIVVTLCTNGFNLGNKVWSKVGSQQDHMEEVISAQRFIRKVLSEAVYYVLDDKNLRSNYFNGKKNRMVFLAPSPQYGIDDHLYIYEIYKEINGDYYNLSLKYLPANTYFSGSVNSTDKTVKLLRNLKQLEFKYYGTNPRTGELVWHDSWLKRETLPLKVSISAKTSSKSFNWPLLIAETKYGGYLLP